MEGLFSPCTRLHDLLESDDILADHEFDNVKELNLNVSTEELLRDERDFTYEDLLAMSQDRDTIAWLTPNTAVVDGLGRALNLFPRVRGIRSFYFATDGNDSTDGKDVVASGRSSEALSDICDVVLRLLAASAVHSVLLDSLGSRDIAVINAPGLACLMKQCQSLKALSLVGLKSLQEDQIRVLGTYSRPDLEIELISCGFTSSGTSALAEVLGRSQGPTKLHECVIDTFVLAEGLRGNSRLQFFRPLLSHDAYVGSRQILAIASAMRENKGLVALDLGYNSGLRHDLRMSDETWWAVCDSLQTHPTLEVLNLRPTYMHQHPDPPAPAPPAEVISRIQAILDMLKVNMLIHTIHVESCYSEHELFRKSVIPHLATNRSRPRLRDIQKTRPLVYRAKVLGRALVAVRTDPNLLWMFLSGNAEIAFPSTTAPTTSLPIPATATSYC